jgi:hypothetical protein
MTMTRTTEDQTNLPAGDRREWARPVLHRMEAGSAEVGDGPSPDGFDPS